MPSINPNQPYPGTQMECAKTPGLQRLLDHFEKAKVHSKHVFFLQILYYISMIGF